MNCCSRLRTEGGGGISQRRTGVTRKTGHSKSTCDVAPMQSDAVSRCGVGVGVSGGRWFAGMVKRRTNERKDEKEAVVPRTGAVPNSSQLATVLYCPVGRTVWRGLKEERKKLVCGGKTRERMGQDTPVHPPFGRLMRRVLHLEPAVEGIVQACVQGALSQGRVTRHHRAAESTVPAYK